MENIDLFILPSISKPFLKEFRDKLSFHNYNETALRGLEIDPCAITPYCLPLDEHKVKDKNPLNILILLFTLGEAISRKEIGTVFDSREVKELLKINVLAVTQGDRIISMVCLFPYEGFYFVSDFRIRLSHVRSSWFKKLKKELIVYSPGLDSVALAEGRIRDEVDYILDLCTGCGIQAILASRHGKRVVGTDISSRAINYSKFNALLNDVKNVEFKLGDLYDPVKSEKFDLILTNPPFVATSGASKLYRDGGERGDRVLNRILSELPQHLKRDGYCQIITLLSEFDSVSHEESLRRFSLKGAYNTLILTLNEMSPYQLALAQYKLYLENYEDYRKRVIQYLDFLQKIGLKKTELSLVTIKHDLSGRFEKRRLYVSINVPFRSIDRIKEYYGQPHLH